MLHLHQQKNMSIKGDEKEISTHTRAQAHTRTHAHGAISGTAAENSASPPTAPFQLCVRAGLRHQPAAYFGVFLIVMLLRPDPTAHKVVTDRVGQGKVVVPFCCHISVLHQGKMEVPVEISF